MRDQDGREGHVVVARPGVVVQEQEGLDDVVQAQAHFRGMTVIHLVSRL